MVDPSEDRPGKYSFISQLNPRGAPPATSEPGKFNSTDQ